MIIKSAFQFNACEPVKISILKFNRFIADHLNRFSIETELELDCSATFKYLITVLKD